MNLPYGRFKIFEEGMAGWQVRYSVLLWDYEFNDEPEPPRTDV
jgi:hypothetical protein